MSKKILVVDDEPVFTRMVSQALSHKGYEMFVAGDGREALKVMFDHKPDLVLLDVVMPGMDGWQTCSRIRELSDVPIVMLTGKHKTEADVVRGLDYGADDYLIKPIGIGELVARVQAMLRRSEMPVSSDSERKLSYNDEYLSVDITERRITLNGERVKLTPTEFKLFAMLLENAGRILTQRQLLEKVWGWEYIDDIDHLRIYIWHLRRKIEQDSANPKYILTEAGVGYFFQENSSI